MYWYAVSLRCQVIPYSVFIHYKLTVPYETFLPAIGIGLYCDYKRYKRHPVFKRRGQFIEPVNFHVPGFTHFMGKIEWVTARQKNN